MASITELGLETAKRYGTALSHSDFRTLWTANIFAGAAAWALIVSRGWLVFDMSDGATASLWVGVVTFAAMIPRVLVTPFSGYLSDRFDRRVVLRSMFGINLVNNLVLAVLVSTGNIEIWHLVVLSLVNGSARASQMPAAQALIPNLVPRHTLMNAIALNEATMQGSRLLGPAAILPLMLTTGIEGAFFLCTAFYAVSLVQGFRLRTESTGKVDRQRGLASNLAEGFIYCYKTPHLRALIYLTLLHCGLTMSYESLLPILSQQRLGAEGAGVATLMMAVGAGAMLSSVALAGVRSELTRGRTFFYMGILSGVAPAILAVSTTMPMALLGAALL
ncbi:MAG: MFS transporter, partial [Chloroflexi bacterium]|nr:MFS transporter [Chloroflexota bacterium]